MTSVEQHQPTTEAGEAAPIELTKDGGVLKTILRPGRADSYHPLKGDTVVVHYVGTLKETGVKFDSSRDRAEPFRFSIGRGQVIKGWDVGVASMHEGELARLECRADYAYGDNGSPPKIPAGATLIFEVELIRWEGEDLSPERDGTIMKSMIVEGEKYNCPSENSMVTVHIVGKCAGRKFYDRELTYSLGEGSEYQLPDGVDRALRRCNKGEKCRVTLRGVQFTYGPNPPPEFGLEPNAELLFIMFLKDFEKTKQSWELLDEEKLEVAAQSKERGTAFFQQGKYTLAMSKYNSVVLLLEHARPGGGDVEAMTARFQDMYCSALLNCALVNLKLGENAECIKNCDKVLDKKPNSVKALYRKAQGLQNRKDFDEAVAIFQKVVELEPENKAALQQILVCREQQQAQRERERRRFAGMFDKLSSNDDGGAKKAKQEQREDGAGNQENQQQE